MWGVRLTHTLACPVHAFDPTLTLIHLLSLFQNLCLLRAPILDTRQSTTPHQTYICLVHHDPERTWVLSATTLTSFLSPSPCPLASHLQPQAHLALPCMLHRPLPVLPHLQYSFVTTKWIVPHG